MSNKENQSEIGVEEMEMADHCKSCGYTEKDAKLHMDHHLCKNAGNAPWELRADRQLPSPPLEDPEFMPKDTQEFMENLGMNEEHDFSVDKDQARDMARAKAVERTQDEPKRPLSDPERMMDLIRYMRHEIWEAKLISNEEFAALVADSENGQRVARLESYDEMRKAAKNELS